MIAAAPELALAGVFIGVLICVLAMMALKLACPPTSLARDQLFASGAVYPYTRVVSLKLSILLPWRSAPNFAGCHRSAPGLLAVARLGAGIAALSLVLLILLGAWRVAA